MKYFPTQVVEIAIDNVDEPADLVSEGRTISDLTPAERADYTFMLALVISHSLADGYLRVQGADNEVYELADAYARPLDFSELAELIA